ncbi:MAG: extracellular solute-binding protein [Clostridiales bacterium]|nr:extracellular solute-binding protein [Clostridiales bacterium]
MKKFLALLLCAVMIVPMFSGALAEEKELRTVTILAGAQTEPYLTAEYADYEAGKYFDKVIAELGLKIEIEGVDDSSFSDVVSSRIAAGVDLPDVIGSGWWEFDAMSWAENGMILPVSDLLAEYDPENHILDFYNKYCPGAVGANTAPDGKMYWFSYLNNITYIDPETGNVLPQENARTTMIRKDWLDKAGIEWKDFYTPEELYNIMVKFQEVDVNGNGVKDEVLNLPFDSFQNGVAKAFGLSMRTLAGYGEDNVVFSNFYHENFDDYITYMQKMYNEGYIDSGVLGTSVLDNEILTENKAAVTFGYAHWEGLEKLIADENALYVPFFLDADAGADGFSTQGDLTSGTYCKYVVTKACKDPQAVVDLFKYLYTQEHSLLNYWGLEGIGYELDEKGVVVPIPWPENYDPYVVYGTNDAGLTPNALPSMRTFSMYKEAVPAGLDAKAVPKYEFLDRYRSEYLAKCWYEPTFEELAIASDEEKEVLDDITEQLNTYASELLVDLILGRKSLDDMDKYRGEMEQLGIKEYMEVIQAQRIRFVESGK